MEAIAVLAVLLCAGTDDATLDRLADVAESQRVDLVKDLEKSLAYRSNRLLRAKRQSRIDPSLEIGIIESDTDGRMVFSSAKAKREEIDASTKAIAELKNQISALKEESAVILPYLPANLAVGDVGRTASKLQVVQVVDEHNMIVEGDIGSTRTAPAGTRNTMQWASKQFTVWVESVDTSKFVDGGTITLSETFEVAGTKRYSTVAGSSRAIFLLKPIDTTALKPLVLEKRRLAKEQKQ